MVQLDSVEWLIFDEADKLFEEGKNGFRDQVSLNEIVIVVAVFVVFVVAVFVVFVLLFFLLCFT